jgi:sterol desaturase/sphingolipid hydroxylase (fatty acid hydroxylase superfamily)
MTAWIGAHFESIPFIISILIFAFAFIGEFVLAAVLRRNIYEAKDTLSNLAMYLGNILIDAAWLPIVYLIYVRVHAFSPWQIGSGWWLFQGDTSAWAWVALFLAEDLCYYIFHRTSHGLRLLWSSHENHHSSRFFNLSVAARQTWTPFFAFPFWLPLLLIGFDPLMVLTQQIISLTYQALIHTELIDKLGPLDRILNTPSNHRVHHGTNEKYIDRNFGGILIIWDRIFGTYVCEEQRPTYGILPPLNSYSPSKIAFHAYVDLFRDWSTKGPRQ